MKNRITNNFDGLRLLGALMVLFSHQLALSGHVEPRVFGIKLGTLGVMIFFTISGYLVTASWEKDPQIIRFLCRRLLRLWPALALCLTVCIGLVCILMIPPSHRAIVPDLLLAYLPNYVFIWTDGVFFAENPHKFLNASLWTIPLEVQCYGALLLFGWIARRHLRNVLIALVVAIGVLQFQSWPSIGTGLPQFFQTSEGFNLPIFFLAGALLYFLPILRSHIGTCAIVFLGLTAGILGRTDIALFFLIPVIVLSIGLASWPMFRNATHFGDLSYGIYLWAWPIEQLGVSVLGQETPWPVLLALSILATVSLAFISWHLVEKRCLAFKPSNRQLPTSEI